ncbi:bifunctional DNA primase/polymerase [Actinomadura gamaensis]|uniref:Bifunctional DNA primase/polymerase n=1 Tax=Actinomadura gamaensis TaxID=1763541 RepID=A0ABV9U4Z2_9ACTN
MSTRTPHPHRPIDLAEAVPGPDAAVVARWLIARGMYVFTVDHPALPVCVGAHRPDAPCDGDRGKHPVGRWSQRATRDPAAIGRDLARGPRNLGIACKPSGLLVIDEDRPGAFTDFAHTLGEQVPATFTVDTAKGRHFYFAQPADGPLGNSPGALPDGIDVRGAAGQGGYVVAPGSLHQTGIRYTPVDSTAPVLTAPSWLTNVLRARPGQHTARHRPAQRPAVPAEGGRPFRVLCALVNTVLAATTGDRNNRLYWAACRMYEHADRGLFDEGAARAALADAAHHVGLGDSETEHTLDSARAMTAHGGAA